MTHSTSAPESSQPSTDGASTPSEVLSTQPQPSYVKLAMRNMVRKGGTSLKHFFLTIIGILAVLFSLAYLTR